MKIKCYYTGPIQVNTYLCYDEETLEGFVVDPGGPSASLLNDIDENHVSLKYVLLTHGHGDHIGGVEELMARYPDAKLVASHKEMDLLTNKLDNVSREMFGRTIILHPDLLVKEGDMLSIGNISFKVLETPGHTPGGICFYTTGIVFSGDTLFRQSIGRTDFPGGDQRLLFNSIREKLYTLPEDTVVLPGHMGQTDIGFEKRNNYFV